MGHLLMVWATIGAFVLLSIPLVQDEMWFTFGLVFLVFCLVIDKIGRSFSD